MGDKRHTKRLVRLAEQVVSHPAGEFPEQTETWADLKSAYRLLDSADVTFEAVAQSHWQQTRGQTAGRYLVLGDEASAVLAGRPYVTGDDIRRIALPVLRHRIVTNCAAEAEGVTSDDIITRLLEETAAHVV